MRPLLSSIFRWATASNHAAGPFPWSGQPARVAPVANAFLPQEPCAAEDLNFLHGRSGDDLAMVVEAFGNSQAINWGPLTSSYAQIMGAAFDAPRGRWLLMTEDGGGSSHVVESNDSGQSWADLGAGASSVAALGMFVDGASGDVYAFENGVANVLKLSYVGGAWTNHGGSVPAWSGNVDVTYDGTRWIAVGEDGGTDPLEVWSSANGTTWSKGVLNVLVSGGERGSVAASPTRVVLVQRRAAAAAACFAYATSDDSGVTWDDRTFDAGLSLGSDLIRHVTYDAASELFVLAVKSGGNSKFWTSSDALTWTMAPSQIVGDVTGIACLGSLWVAATSGNNVNLLWFSADHGQTTWRAAESTLPSDSTTTTLAKYFRSQVYASATRFLAVNGKGVRVSFGS